MVARRRGPEAKQLGSHLAWTDTPHERTDRFPEGPCECGDDLAARTDLGVADCYGQHDIPQVAVKATPYDLRGGQNRQLWRERAGPRRLPDVVLNIYSHCLRGRPHEVTMDTGVLVFDGRCGFCTRSVGWLRRVDRRRRVELVPLQLPGAPARVGATVEECLAAVRWQHADGSRAAAAEAINSALAAALGTPVPVLVYRVTRRLQEWLYRWVADNRYRLPGATPWCERYPADCRAAGWSENRVRRDERDGCIEPPAC